MKIVKSGGDGSSKVINIGEDKETVEEKSAPIVETGDTSLIVDEDVESFIEGNDKAIQDAVDNAIELSQNNTKDFSKFISGGYRTCDYYQLNRSDSMSEAGEQVALYGENSPRKYTHIGNFPIFGYEVEREESDSSTPSYLYSARGYIAPDMILPGIDDLVVARVGDKRLIFKIASRESSRGVKKIYQIEMISIAEYTEDESASLKLSVEDVKYCILGNIGTNKATIMSKHNVALLSKIRKLREQQIELFFDMAYKGPINTFIYKLPDGRYVYDKYMTYFIAENDLLEGSDFPSTGATIYMVDDKFLFKSEYRKTAFSAFESGKVDVMRDHKMGLSLPPRDNFTGRLATYLKGAINVVNPVPPDQAHVYELTGLPYHQQLPDSILIKMRSKEAYSDGELNALGRPGDAKRELYSLIVDSYLSLAGDIQDWKPVLNQRRIEDLENVMYELMDQSLYTQLIPFVMAALKREEDRLQFLG